MKMAWVMLPAWLRRLDYFDVDNLDVFLGLFFESPDIFNLMNDIHALKGAPEYGVLVVQPWLRLLVERLRR